MKQVKITTPIVVVTMVLLNSLLSLVPSSEISIAKQNATAPLRPP